MLWLMLIVPQWAYAECSPFAGLASINEISEKDGFIELKRLSSSVPASEYETWRLEFCALTGNGNNISTECSGLRSVALASQNTSPWLVMDSTDLGNRQINLQGMDVRLSDSMDRTIDYIRVGSSVSGSEDSTCSSSPDELPFDTQLTLVGGESGKYARRDPDGTGDWAMGSGGSGGKDTGGNTNDDGVTGPVISVDNVTMLQGETATFTVTLGSAASRDILIDYGTFDSSATQGVDYVSRAGTLTIPLGQTQGTVSVPTLQSGAMSQRQFLLRISRARDDAGDRYGILESEVGVGNILPAPVGDWHFDEGPWNGSPGEVLDSSGNDLHGRAVNATRFSIDSPARPGSPGTCGYGDFDGTGGQFIEVSDQPELDLPGPMTVSTWINVRRFPGNGINTIVSKDENFEFHINSNREVYWWWRTSNGGTHSFTTNGANLVAGQWYHIAVVYQSGLQQIFVNGVERGRATRSGNLMTNGDPLHIGQDQFFSGRYFDGLIDEVAVYKSALNSEGVGALYRRVRPCAFNRLDGFEVSVPATASVCGVAEVTVRAFDQNGSTLSGYDGSVSLRTSSGSGNWSAGAPDIPVGVFTPNPDTDNDGFVSYQFSSADGGSVSFSLENATADQLTVLAEDLGAGVQGISGPVQFQENAFVIGSIDGNGADIVAERDHAFEVSAVRRDPATGECGLVPDYNGQIDLKAWLSRSGDDAGGVAPALDGGAGSSTLGNTTPASDNLTLMFNGGSANFTLSTADVGQYRLNLLDNTSGIIVDVGGAPVPLAGSGALWTVRPDRFSLFITDNPAAASANGTAFRAAGAPFELVLQAVGAAGNSLPGFGQEGSPQGADLTHGLLQPSGGVAGLLSGTVSVPGSSFSGGTALVGDLSWNEVGILELTANNPGYLGATPAFNGTSGAVGRFVPDRFELAIAPGELAAFCSAGAPFVYSGQPATWSVVPELTISAMGPGSYVTRNYTQGGFMKLTAAAISRAGPVKDNSATDLAGGDYPVTANLEPGLLSVTNPGVLTYSFSTNDELIFGKSVQTRVAPFTPDITVFVNDVRDSDGVSAPGAPYAVLPLAPLELRYGRWQIENVYGPEDVDALSMSFQAQFWNGSRFVAHASDSCSNWSTALISDPEVHHSLVANSGVLTGGSGGPLRLEPKGTQGTDTLLWDVPSWLEDDYDGDGSLGDPRGLATFGVYRGHDRVIYWQER
ncbi:DUF6701 domain-containing protein [Marinobacter sp.]|uniref:DUF6701 domain-containing protein n=1 Tax=Marinobacter sp. TaxID=50741 RepID=UPI003A8F02D6